MELISTAIMGALAKPIASDVATGYKHLKGLIVEKCGRGSHIDKAIEGCEEKPESPGRQATLQEEVKEASLLDDADILAAAQSLLDCVAALAPADNCVVKQKAGNDATQINQKITGNDNVQVAGDMVITQKHTTKTTVVPRPTDISEEQLFDIKQRISELAKIDEEAGEGNTYGKRTNQFKKAFKIDSVARLDASRFDETMKWFRESEGRDRRKLYGKNSDALVKRLRKAIQGKRARMDMTRDELHVLAEQNLGKPVPSITKLGVQDLTKLDRIVQNRLNQSKKLIPC